MSREYPPMQPRQRLRAYDLVRRECCNYDDGMCVVLENGYGDACVQCISHSVMCRWFRDAVLPLDAGLKKELYPETRGKQCEQCGVFFHPGSNRSRFCKECAKWREKRKRAERMRKRRRKAKSCNHLEHSEAL